MKTIAIAALILAAATTAHAGGQAGTVGVGVEAELSGLAGLSANYDAGRFHVGGFFGINDPAGPGDEIELGGRFFYHVHSTAMSDFGLGAGLGLASVSPGIDGNTLMRRATRVFLEPAFQIRLFIAANVALSFTGGISFGLEDADGASIRGELEGGAGVHYYFF